MKYLVFLLPLLLCGCSHQEYVSKEELFFRIRNYCDTQAYNKLPKIRFSDTFNNCMSNFLYFDDRVP
jgi:hypothetical protein